ncbi:ECF transporter S component [Protaetiibacter larvae]|uniref:ECF transporter S component n=1 Tax=Protaetiibacter larvae TaxID=2592654 RepID=A0A5C1Y6A3_9MICO|nr:ECF transporter S component [Protaetiibacter larvae]QEO09424.1 hypothetical protein FLP23_05020 [Protaetiibacter larvae]
MRSPYSTRVFLSAAAIGAAGGVVAIALNWIFLAINTTPLATLIIVAVFGVWVLPGMLAQRLFTAPGIGAFTMLVAALVNAPFTPYGVAQIWSSIIFGVLLEVPFAVTGYRFGGQRMFWIAHPLSQLAVIPFYLVGFDLAAFAWWVLPVFVLLTLASAAFFTWLAQFLAARLRAAGVARPRVAA